jgi:putative N6-adenine-specific DNA methylase
VDTPSPTSVKRITFFAACAQGIEEILAEECRRLDFAKVRAGRGGVHFEGSFRDGMRACLWLRTANRVQVQLMTFKCPDADTLYENVQKLAWEHLILEGQTMAVRAMGTNNTLRNTAFNAQKTKDAIVDRIRDHHGWRPNVDKKKPDLPVALHLAGTQARLYLNLSGESLHRRAYRMQGGEAPLKETLAAAMILWSGWDGTTPFVDPMCGSGTLVIEATLIATKRPPGLHQKHVFLNWASTRDQDKRDWKDLCEEAFQTIVRGELPEIVGVERDKRTFDAAKKNTRAAGVANDVKLVHGDGLAANYPPKNGFIITNPPYGHRMGDSSEAIQMFYRKIGARFRTHRGYEAFIISGNDDFPDCFGLRYEDKLGLKNGQIPCHLYRYAL